MAQVSYEDYRALYGEDGLDQAAFDRLAWEARHVMENVTTGVDGVRKLAVAAPTEGSAAEAVKRCELALVHILHEAESVRGTVAREDGTVTGKVVTSVAAGAESVSYAAPSGQSSSGEELQKRLRQTAEEYLAGAADKNGVPLLFAGKYPVRLEVD